jgi:hypothetical protein
LEGRFGFFEIGFCVGFECLHLLLLFVDLGSSLNQFIFLIIRLSGFLIDFNHELFAVFRLFTELILEDGKIFLQFIRIRLSLIKFGESSTQFLDLSSDLSPLIVEKFTVSFDQFDVIGGSYVIQSFEFLVHSLGKFDDFCMGISEVMSDIFSCIFIKIELFN